jgi:hypothetical protein
MATDFGACGFGAITPDLILKSLIGCDTVTGQKKFRVQLYTVSTLTPVHCGSDEDFEINLRRALDMGYDDKVVLRVNVAQHFEGAEIGIGECDCGFATTVPDMLNSLFGEDAQGVVYFNVASITT